MILINWISGIALCEQWEFSCNLLTGQVWKRHIDEQWKGSPIELKFLSGFRKKLEEVYSLAVLGGQLGKLLGDEEAEKETATIIETVMRGADPLTYSPFTETAWKSRLTATERALDSLTERAIPLLRARLQPNKLESNQVFLSSYKVKINSDDS